MNTRIGLTTLALLLFTACGDSGSKTSDTDADSTGATDSSSTTGSTGASDTTAGSGSTTGDTTGDAPTTGVVTTTNDSVGSDTSDTDATTGGETTGPVDPEVMSLCEAFCGRWTECGEPNEAECMPGCIADIGSAEGACEVAFKDLVTCAVELTCEQLLDDSADGPCVDKQEAVEQTCFGGEEEDYCSYAGGTYGDECDVTIECPNEPIKKMLCTGDTCTCTVGDEKVGECKTDGACMDIDGLEAKSETCCGF